MNKKTLGFKKKLIATAIASYSFAGLSGMSYAQDEVVEEVIVTGIRGSLQRSMDIKRDARGVVDAISAEDIGKFPDTNLAESLQRISGVSIDRVNGEGSKVTVRGFGPDYNLVTLNGRQMPTADLGGGNAASTSRSFDFANLASESVSGVEVFKTARANINSGGIGAVINIKTARPLDNPGMKASVGVKGVIDESSDKGDDVTPEISGIFSTTFADDMFGIAVSGSYQERDSGYRQAGVTSGWRSQRGDDAAAWGAIPQPGAPGSENITNRPWANDIYSNPQNINYSFHEIQRARTNGQLVLQYAPTDRIEATLDYTYSKNEVAQQFNDVSAWFGFGGVTAFYTDGPVSSPLVYSEFNPAGNGDLAMGAGSSARVSENSSVGLNVTFAVNDNLTLELDAHSSTAETVPDSPYGSNNIIGTAAFIRGTTTVDFRQAWPVMSIEYGDDFDGLQPSQMQVAGSVFHNAFMEQDIDQYQLKGSYTFDDSIIESIDFGVGNTEVAYRSAYGNAQLDTWGGLGSAGDLDATFWPRETIRDKVDIPGAKNPNMLNEFFMFDFERVVTRAGELYGVDTPTQQWPCVRSYCAPSEYSTDRRTVEESFSAFGQVNLKTELAGMETRINIGIRYEETDVNSQALVPTYESTVVWAAANELYLTPTGEQDFTNLSGSYDNVLPSIDISIKPSDDVVIRASASQTLGRPGYADIQGGLTVDQLVRIDGGNGRSGNPNLLPLESTNYDISSEWYYDDASYVSVGYFFKEVKNFVGTSVVRQQIFDLPHPAQGERAAEARAALGAGATNDEIRAYIIANTPPGDPSVDGTDIYGIAGEDPATLFNVTVPVNEKEAQLKGWEFAAQHMFGETGFGGIVNYTKVDGSIGFDNLSLEQQFALTGLSDSANLVGFFDRDGFQVRVAYNWRDKFLAATQTGNGNFDPIFVEAYGQWDVNISYDVTDNVTVFAEGINITDEYNRSHARRQEQLIGITETGPRYNIGARVTF